MAKVINCPSCGCSLNLPEEALSRQAKCPRCANTFVPTRSPDEPVAYPGVKIVLETEEVLPTPIPGLPPPPRPLSPVLVDSRREGPIEDPEGGLQRCPRCRARVTANMNRCSACGARLVAAEDDRPWESKGGPLRRDCEPHRGPLILVLGRASLCLAIPGLLGVAFYPLSLASILGAGIGLTVWIMSKDDLEQMESKIMDPEGRRNTEAGQKCAKAAMVLGAVGLVLTGLLRLPMLFASIN
jgi:hypothetical protein